MSVCPTVHGVSAGWGKLTQDAKRLKVYKKEKQLAKWFTRSLPCPATKNNNNKWYDNNNLADSSKISFQFPSCLWAFSWHRLLLCVFNQIIMTSKQNTDGSTSPSFNLSLSLTLFLCFCLCLYFLLVAPNEGRAECVVVCQAKQSEPIPATYPNPFPHKCPLKWFQSL